MMTGVASEVVDYLLFIDETKLTGRVRGGSGFAERFSAIGPRDRKGRSLHELDLNRRLMKYPCSYLIYSPAFDALPTRREGPHLQAHVGSAVRAGSVRTVPVGALALPTVRPSSKSCAIRRKTFLSTLLSAVR